jgi:acyl-CoA thioesterase I
MPVKSSLTAYVFTVAFLLVGLLTGCNETESSSRGDVTKVADTAASPLTVQGPERLVLAFGDSLYSGYGLKRGESLPARVEVLLRQKGINATVVNAGVSGDTTSAGRKRLVFALENLPRKPDLVMLGLGGNDVLRQIPVSETRANLVAMLDELRKRGIPVVLTGMRAPPNLGADYVRQFNTIYPELAREYRVELDPFVLAGVLGERQLMLPDGIHPNEQGVGVMAARLAPIVAGRL